MDHLRLKKSIPLSWNEHTGDFCARRKAILKRGKNLWEDRQEKQGVLATRSHCRKEKVRELSGTWAIIHTIERTWDLSCKHMVISNIYLTGKRSAIPKKMSITPPARLTPVITCPVFKRMLNSIWKMVCTQRPQLSLGEDQSRPSISVGSSVTDSINCRLNLFGKKER